MGINALDEPIPKSPPGCGGVRTIDVEGDNKSDDAEMVLEDHEAEGWDDVDSNDSDDSNDDGNGSNDLDSEEDDK